MNERPSQVARAVAAIAQPVFQIVVGLVFLVGGCLVTAKAVSHEPHDKWLFGFGFGAAIGGALILPGIFSTAKPIFVFFFPNGLPLFGGRRAGDPPAPPPA
jgi:hypothetical protein